MSISRETLQQLHRGQYEAIEEAWLGRVDAQPFDAAYFAGVGRALAGNGEEKRARALLDLLDGELKRQNRWQDRLDLLRHAAPLWVAAEKTQSEALATLRRLYGERANFQPLVQGVGLHQPAQSAGDAVKLWDRVERLEALLGFEIGAIVWMEARGVGRVSDVNLGLETFKIDFEKTKGVSVGFRVAGKLLRTLPPGHLLRRRLEDPASLAALRPPDLLAELLRSNEKPMTAAEVRDAVGALVAESQWSAWWTAARKHPQVVAAGSGSRQLYSWAASSAAAADKAWAKFEAAPLRERLDLFRRSGTKDPALRERMADALAAGAEIGLREDPGVAFEIWHALDRSGGATTGELAWTPDALIDAEDSRRLLAGIQDRALRERAYVLVRERRDDWAAIYGERFGKEEDPRTLNLIAEGLQQGAAADFGRWLDQILAQPRKFPAAFVWLAESAGQEDDRASRSPLRLLQQILTALDADEFLAYRARLKPLADSGGSLPRLLQRLTEEQGVQARDAIQKAAGLEGHQRTPLLNTLEMRFKSLRKEIDQPLYATPESIRQRRAELKHLLEVEIPTNRKAIEEARALGDLRENFEYKAARQRHEYLASRTAALDGELRRVRPLDPATIDPSQARIGTTIELATEGGEVRRLTLLGPWESAPEAGVISYESELAKSLLGKHPGEAIEIEARRFVIRAIERYRAPLA
jgi:transcription elongation factor GreA